MATYNWTYKYGVTNKYSLSIPSTTDIVRPTGFAYVAPWGNDTTGNGSRQYPYRTIVKGCQIVGALNAVIIASGVYRESFTGLTAVVRLVGDGNVILDGTTLGNFHNSAASFDLVRNVTIRGYTTLGANSMQFIDCSISDMSAIVTNRIQNCIFSNCEVRPTSITTAAGVSNNTFYKSNVLFLGTHSTQTVTANIFSDCNISFANSPSYFDYCLFYNSNFRFNSTTLSGGTTFPPSVPSGYSSYTIIADLRAANVTAFGAATYNFNNCAFGDPLFNGATLHDFTIAVNSPAKNKAYNGNYAGACSIATKLSVTTNQLTSSFDNSSATNLTIAADSIKLTNTSLPGTIVAKPIYNPTGRQINRLMTIGYYSDRNGEFFSSVLSLSSSTLSPGNVPINTPYLVEGGSITYNGNVYLAGDRFTSASTLIAFTTTTGGVIREILQAPSTQTVEARFNDGSASTVDNTATLTVGTWYHVVSGSATYNGDSYSTGDFIKCVSGVTSFTGTAILRPTFASGDTYYLFEINSVPLTTNNTGNVRTGSIIRGNGHPDFDRTNAFSVNMPYIQTRYTIQSNNLT